MSWQSIQQPWGRLTHCLGSMNVCESICPVKCQFHGIFNLNQTGGQTNQPSDNAVQNPFYLDHMIRGSVVLSHNSPPKTPVNPLLFIASASPKCLFFWSFPAEFSLLQLRFICRVGVGVAWSHTAEAAVFHWAFCLLIFFISSPRPPEPSPLLTIKDAPVSAPSDPTNPLSWPPAFVNMELLCNFMSKTKNRLEIRTDNV